MSVDIGSGTYNYLPDLNNLVLTAFGGWSIQANSFSANRFRLQSLKPGRLDLKFEELVYDQYDYFYHLSFLNQIVLSSKTLCTVEQSDCQINLELLGHR